MMSRCNWALLLLAALADAREPKGGEIEKDNDLGVLSHIDPVTSSFYPDVERKAQSVGCRFSASEQQAMTFGTFVACSLACDLLCGPQLISKLSGGMVPTRSALLRGNAPEAVSEAVGGVKEGLQSTNPCPHQEDGIKPASTSHAWLSTALLALLASAVALGSSKARRPLGCRRLHSGTPSANTSPRCSLASVSDQSTSQCGTSRSEPLSSTGDATEFSDDSESGLENAGSFGPEQTKVAGTERAMCQQSMEPWGEDERGGYCRKTTESQMLRQQSYPTPGGSKRNFDTGTVDLLQYGTGRFVRKRTEEYEQRIDFHRIASEYYVATEADAYEHPVDSKTEFHRIDAEKV